MRYGIAALQEAEEIHGRHFIQTVERAGLPKAIVREAIKEVLAQAEKAITHVEAALPPGLPEYIHGSVSAAYARGCRA